MKNLFLTTARFATEFIFGSCASPSLRSTVIDKIMSFGLLPEGWDFGIGKAAPQNVIELATKLYEHGSRIGLMADAFPGTGGEIYVAFYKDNDTVELCVNLDLSLIITLERGVGVDFEELDYIEGVSFDGAINYLNKFSLESRCNLSEPYIALNTTETVNDSQVIASRTTMEVSRSSILNVLEPQVSMYAYT